MSGPENSEIKGPPSLLSSGAADDKSQSNRILASLEGQVGGATRQPAAARRRRGAVSLLLLLLCATALGFWVTRDKWNATGGGAVKQAQLAPAGSHLSPGTTSAPAATLAAASTAVAASVASEVTQTATIVNDTDTPASAAASNAPASSAPPAAAASAAPVAMADAGASATHEPHRAAHEAAARGKASDKVKTASASHSAHHEHDHTVAAEHTKSAEHGTKELAKTEKTEKADRAEHTAQARARGDDPDVDLLAVLVARTKPAVRTSAAAPRHDPLSEQLKQCDKLGFFAAEKCRQDACAGQAGKDMDCPAVQASSTH